MSIFLKVIISIAFFLLTLVAIGVTFKEGLRKLAFNLLFIWFGVLACFSGFISLEKQVRDEIIFFIKKILYLENDNAFAVLAIFFGIILIIIGIKKLFEMLYKKIKANL